MMTLFNVGDILYNKKYKTVDKIIKIIGEGMFEVEILESFDVNFAVGSITTSIDEHVTLYEVYKLPLYQTLLDIDINK